MTGTLPGGGGGNGHGLPSNPLGVGCLCRVHRPSGEELGDLEAVLLDGPWEIRPLQIPPFLAVLVGVGVTPFPSSFVLELCG